MQLGATLGVLIANAIWRATGLRSVGRRLIVALGSRDENVSTIAGMCLVKAGAKALPLLQEALDRREHLPQVLQIIADIGEPGTEATLERFTRDPDPKVAKAAGNALRVLFGA